MAIPRRTITRADLIQSIHQDVRLSRGEVASLLDQLLDEVVCALERGEPMRISSFGAFETRLSSKRIGRNPKTGQVVPIERRRVVHFRPSPVLKDYINGLPVKKSRRRH